MPKIMKNPEFTFTSLVKEIDSKWGHTYIDVPLTKEEISMEEIMKEIREAHELFGEE